VKYLEKFFYQITNIGAFVACIALLATMVITVSNIIYRMSGYVIIGTYDLTELLIVVFVGFSIAYTVLTKGHVSVRVIVELFSKRSQNFFKGFTLILGFLFWALTVWSSTELAIEKAALGEKTDILSISYIPFRWFFIFGLFLVSINLLLDFVKLVRGDHVK
jgi:TRAP-type transport system small permease protein